MLHLSFLCILHPLCADYVVTPLALYMGRPINLKCRIGAGYVLVIMAVIAAAGTEKSGGLAGPAKLSMMLNMLLLHLGSVVHRFNKDVEALQREVRGCGIVKVDGLRKQ